MIETEFPAALSDIAQDTLDALGYTDPWKIPAQDTLDMIFNRKNLIRGVSDDIFSEIKSEIAIGLTKGESIAQISKRITKAFDDITSTRAELIAETETGAAYNYASYLASKRVGVRYKQWIHSNVPKVPRPDHLAIDGLIIPIDEAYPVGDPPLMYPHDPDGAAADVINCYCISIPVTEEEYRAQKK